MLLASLTLVSVIILCRSLLEVLHDLLYDCVSSSTHLGVRISVTCLPTTALCGILGAMSFFDLRHYDFFVLFLLLLRCCRFVLFDRCRTELGTRAICRWTVLLLMLLWNSSWLKAIANVYNLHRFIGRCPAEGHLTRKRKRRLDKLLLLFIVIFVTFGFFLCSVPLVYLDHLMLMCCKIIHIMVHVHEMLGWGVLFDTRSVSVRPGHQYLRLLFFNLLAFLV